MTSPSPATGATAATWTYHREVSRAWPQARPLAPSMKFVALTSAAVPTQIAGVHHSETSKALCAIRPSPAPRTSWRTRRVLTDTENRSSISPSSAKASTVASPMSATSTPVIARTAPCRCTAARTAVQVASEAARTMASPPPRGTGVRCRDLSPGTSTTRALLRSGITAAVKEAQTAAVTASPLRSRVVMRPPPGPAGREPAISGGVATDPPPRRPTLPGPRSTEADGPAWRGRGSRNRLRTQPRPR